MKEPLDYDTAQEIDDLIGEIDALNYRIYRLREHVLEDGSEDNSLRDKKYELLRALKEALKALD